MRFHTALAFLTWAIAHGQLIGTVLNETHPALTWQLCNGTGGTSCQKVQGQVVADANWRWVHLNTSYDNCYTGNSWSAVLCPDDKTCAQHCAVDGVSYADLGISTTGNSLRMPGVTSGASTSPRKGNRVFLMSDSNTYQTFNLIGNEISFDVDNSLLGCGWNGALYFVSMDSKGQGAAGAKYGTGYCDAQCPRDLRFINGQVITEIRIHTSPALLHLNTDTPMPGKRRRLDAVVHRPGPRHR
jgi:cellulose 1,4-beta-cellobiosidase